MYILFHTMQLHDTQGKRLYLTADERRAFMAAASKAPRPVRTFCAVLHDSRCRTSEALALTPERIDLTGQALTIETLKKRRSGVYRTVPVPPGLLDQLDLVHGIRESPEARQRACRSSLVAVGAQHRLAARHGRHGRGRARGRAASFAQGIAARLRHPCHRFGRAAQHAVEMDGVFHPGGDGDLCQRHRG